MSLPIELRDEAEYEFDEAFDFYERSRRGLGIRFAYAVQRTFELISRHPFSKRVVMKDVRRAAVAKFPYLVIYRPLPDRIDVIAVFHSSRDPKIWQDRV